jgi:hypothetical protein
MRTRIDRLLERQAEDLARLESGEAKRFLSALEDARRDLAERLARLERAGGDVETPFTAQHLRVAMVEIEAGVAQLRTRLTQDLGDDLQRMRERAADDLIAQVKSAERRFRDAGGGLDVAVLRRLDEERGTLLHQYSVGRYSAQLLEEIQRQLVVGVATGETFRGMRERLLGRDGNVLVPTRARAELIVRMEMNSAYNRAHQGAYKELAQATDLPGLEDDPLLRRLDEHTDMRNHAISRVLDDQVRGLDEPFRAPVAEVDAELRKLNAQRKATSKKKPNRLPKRNASGILWPQVGAEYVGPMLPAHYWERGRQVAHRASWEQHKRPGRTAGVQPYVTGAWDSEREERQAERLSVVLGGTRIHGIGKSSEGIEGWIYSPSSPIPLSMTEWDSTTARRMVSKLNSAAQHTSARGHFGGVFFGRTPLESRRAAQRFSQGVLSRIPSEGTFTRLLIECADGVVLMVDSNGVRPFQGTL